MMTVLYSRFQFAMTVIFHYLFPQFTMSLAVFVVYFRLRARGHSAEWYRKATMFWTYILAITFVFGAVSGVPMEFQFGTNWGRFSQYTGGIIGQTLGMEGVFAFFLESVFLGIMLAGEKRVGRRLHVTATILVACAAWLSAYFILATNAWMQHPVAWRHEGGRLVVDSVWGVLTNGWLFWQYLHNQNAAMITGSCVLAAVGAFYLLARREEAFGRMFVRTGVTAAAIFSCLAVYPTGDGEGKQVVRHQQTKGAAMEGLFRSEEGAPLAIMGQPNMETLELDNPIFVPDALSFLAYGSFRAEVKGLLAFPRDRWPDNVPLVYYAYHIMVGLGTIFVCIMVFSLLLLLLGWLYRARWMLWVIMLTAPFPFIANTAGWVTAETGRQPWVAWELLRTHDGGSPLLSGGNAMFTLLGFLGMYLALGIIYYILCFRVIVRGPSKVEG